MAGKSRYRIAIVILILICVGSIRPLQVAYYLYQAKVLRDAGHDEWDQQKYRQAIELYLRALQVDPRKDKIYVEMGIAYDEESRVLIDHVAIEKLSLYAKSMYKEALRINPENPEAVFRLAEYENNHGNTERAMALYRKAIELDPDARKRVEEIRFNIARNYFNMGRYKEAEERFKKITISDDDNILNVMIKEFLGRIYTITGRYEEAEASLSQSVAGLEKYHLDPLCYGLPYEALGELYARMGRQREVAENYTKAAKALPLDDDSLFRAACEYMAYGDLAKAGKHIEQALSMVTMPEYLTLKGYILLIRQQYQEAESLFRLALSRETENLQARIGLGHVMIAGKDYAMAKQTIEPAFREYEELFRGVESGGWSRRDGWQTYDRLAYEMAGLGMGWMSGEQNRHEQAIGYYDSILAWKPASLFALLGKANSLNWLDRVEEAEKLFEKILKKDPGNPYSLTGMGLVLYKKGADEEAEKAFKEALTKNDNTYSCPYEGLGLLYLKQGRVDEARTNFEMAIDINPDIEYKKFNGLAKIYMQEGKYGEAEKLLEKSVKNYPYDNEAHELLQQIQTDPGN